METIDQGIGDARLSVAGAPKGRVAHHRCPTRFHPSRCASDSQREYRGGTADAPPGRSVPRASCADRPHGAALSLQRLECRSVPPRADRSRPAYCHAGHSRRRDHRRSETDIRAAFAARSAARRQAAGDRARRSGSATSRDFPPSSRLRSKSICKSLGISTIVICGTDFPASPRSTVYAAANRDFRLVLATDAISGATDAGLDETGADRRLSDGDRPIAGLAAAQPRRGVILPHLRRSRRLTPMSGVQQIEIRRRRMPTSASTAGSSGTSPRLAMAGWRSCCAPARSASTASAPRPATASKRGRWCACRRWATRRSVRRSRTAAPSRAHRTTAGPKRCSSPCSTRTTTCW